MDNNPTPGQSVRVRLSLVLTLLVLFAVVFFSGVGVGIHQRSPISVPIVGNVTLETKTENYPQLYRSKGTTYTLSTSRRSFFALDNSGNLILKNSLPYQAERIYRFDRTINPNSAAIVIMDPWIDMPSEFLNEYHGKVLESRTIPLVKHALVLGHPIITFTNNPSTTKYSTKIHPELQALVEDGKASLFYHQDFDDDDFAQYLHSEGIDSLIYAGFDSNWCLIGRMTGMVYMANQGFKIFFVPGASAAVEFGDSWQDQSIHKATTTIVSQWIAELIDYDEFMQISASK